MELRLPNDISSGPCWLFAAERELTTDEMSILTNKLDNFMEVWTAHGQSVEARWEILWNRLVVVAANEDFTQVTGCSKDALFHQMKTISQQLQIDFFNRMYVPLEDQGRVVWKHWRDLSDEEHHRLLIDLSISRIEDLQLYVKTKVPLEW